MVNAMHEKQREMHEMLTDWMNMELTGRAAMQTEEKEQHIEYRIVPNKRDACPIKVLVSNAGGYVVLIGDSLQFESDDGYQNEDVLQILKAVAAGKVRETIWYRGDQIMKSAGAVESGSVPFERKRYRLSSIFLRPQKKVEKQYGAY